MLAAGLLSLLAASPASARNDSHECASYSHWTNISGRYHAWYPTRTRGDFDTITCSLLWGDRGEGVRVLQQNLNRCYKAGLATDGIYGDKTMAAMAKVWRAEVGETRYYYDDYIRWRMDWVHWRYDERGAHSTCIDWK